MSDSTFFFGEWQINPSANSLLLGKQVKQLEPKAMDVLLFLCQRAGEVVSSDEIVSHCWRVLILATIHYTKLSISYVEH